MTMQVVNRKGEREDVRFDAILEKLTTLTDGLDSNWVDPAHLTKLTIEGLYDGVLLENLINLQQKQQHLALTILITANLQQEFVSMTCIARLKKPSRK